MQQALRAQSLAEMASNLEAERVVIPPALWDALRAEGLLHPAAPVPEAVAC